MRDDALPVWGTLPPPAPTLTTVVVMPARDEAERLPAAIDALAAQHGVDPAQWELLLLVNNCGDDSAAVARAAAARHPGCALHVVEATIAPPHAHIGYVRRQLMDEACRRLERAGAGAGWIASTDGDTRVAPDWLAATAAEAAAGAAAVGGRIAVDADADGALLTPRALRLQRLDTAHALLRAQLATLLDPDPADPWPRHHQHFGASLAVSAAGYRQVGGIPDDVEWLEDDALVRAFVGADLPVRHSPSVRVRTSGRLDGRAEVGLSWQLRQWQAADGDEAAVEPPERYANGLVARRHLRDAWRRGTQRPAVDGLARLLGIAPALLRERLCGRRPFGAVWGEIERDRAEALPPDRDAVPMSQAVAALRTLVRDAGRGDQLRRAA